ncbi:MAG: sensor histidine kinase [Anaerolineae bacterium]
MSIRMRLTLLYTALTLLVLGGFSIALYASHSRRSVSMIESGVVAAVEHRAGARDYRPPWEGGAPPDAPAPAPGPAPDAAPNTDADVDPGLLLALTRVDRMRAPVTYHQTLDSDGAVVDKSPALGDSQLPLSADGLAAVSGGETWVERATVDEEKLLIASATIVEDGQIIGVTQAAGSLAMVDRYLDGLRTSLLIMVGLGTIVAFAAGWWFSGAVLHPIDKLTRTAREIGEDRDFSRRVEHSGPDDELGQLAATFNGMLSALQDAFSEVADTLQRQRAFVADASHELRTPLTTIRGNSELLRRDPPISTADHDAVVTDIVSETERLMSLVDELLVLARSDANKKLNVGPVSLAPVLDDLRRDLALIEPERPISIAPGTGMVVIGNETALKQVLLGLVGNALRHTPADADVTVAARSVNGAVSIDVVDSGPGIDPDEVPHLFERFRRGDAARTTPGTGLGLAIAKALTEAQGGTIEVDTELGRGSRFTVRLAALPDGEAGR